MCWTSKQTQAATALLCGAEDKHCGVLEGHCHRHSLMPMSRWAWGWRAGRFTDLNAFFAMAFFYFVQTGISAALCL